MTKKRARSSNATDTPLHDMNEVAELQGRVTTLLMEMQTRENEFNVERDAINKREAEVMQELEEEIYGHCKRIYEFAEKHRHELTQGEKRKTVSVPGAGAFLWYRTPLRLYIEKADDVLAKLKSLSLHRFIRVKEELDRQALLKEPKIAESIDGVTLQRHQKFIIRPEAVKERIEFNLFSKKWSIVLPKSEKGNASAEN